MALGISSGEWEILAPCLRKEKKDFFLAILFAWIGSLTFAGQLYFLSRLLDILLKQEAARQSLSVSIRGFFAFLLVRMLCLWLEEFFSATAAGKVKTGLRKKVLQKLFSHSPCELSNQRSGEIIHSVLSGLDSLDIFFSQYLLKIILAVLLPVTILGIVFLTDAVSGWILLITAPLLPLFQYLIGRTAEKIGSRQWTAMAMLNARFFDMLQGLATWKVFRSLGNGEATVRALSEEYRQATLHALRVAFLSSLISELTATMSTAMVAVGIGLRLLVGRMEVDSGFYVLMLTPFYFSPIRQLGAGFHAALPGKKALSRIREILGTPEMEMGGLADQGPLKDPQLIQFREVTFSYRPEVPLLQGISLELRRDKVYALCGANGCGKTTLLHLLLGFLIPEKGEIRVDGTSLSSISRKIWFSNIAYLPQRPFLFYGTVLENLKVVKENAGMEEIRKCVARAGLEERIESWPQGYQTLLGERGFRLSGGEMQRIALARLYLQDTPILLLDEPAVGLDIQLERHLQKTMKEMSKGRILIWITHHLEVARLADEIIFLHNGRIQAQGNHRVLMERNPDWQNFIGQRVHSHP